MIDQGSDFRGFLRAFCLKFISILVSPTAVMRIGTWGSLPVAFTHLMFIVSLIYLIKFWLRCMEWIQWIVASDTNCAWFFPLIPPISPSIFCTDNGFRVCIVLYTNTKGLWNWNNVNNVLCSWNPLLRLSFNSLNLDWWY